MPLHVDATAAERHSFGFEAQPLLDCRIAPQFDLPARAKDPLPGKPESPPQHANHLPRSSRMSGPAGHAAVSGHLAAGNLADCSNNGGLHGHSAIHPTRISHSEATETSSHRAIPCNSGR